MIALNDGILLWNHINRILRKHFRDQPYYVDLLDLFNEVDVYFFLFKDFMICLHRDSYNLIFLVLLLCFNTGGVPDSLWRNDRSNNYS